MFYQSAALKRCATCQRWAGLRSPGAEAGTVELQSESETGLCTGGPWDGAERRVRSACGHWVIWPALANTTPTTPILETDDHGSHGNPTQQPLCRIRSAQFIAGTPAWRANRCLPPLPRHDGRNTGPDHRSLQRTPAGTELSPVAGRGGAGNDQDLLPGALSGADRG